MTSTRVALENVSTATSRNTTEISDYFNPGTPLDLFMDSLLILVTVVSLYLLVGLLCFEYKVSSRCKPSQPPGRKSRTKYGLSLRVLCISSALFCLLRSVNDIVYYKGQAYSAIPCTVLKNIGGMYHGQSRNSA